MPQQQLTLELDWAYGYRGHQCRNNLHYNKEGKLVYFVAGICVVHDPEKNAQRFYKGHSDDVLCLALDAGKSLAATGQIGKDPYICIWDTLSLKTTSILKGLGHEGGVGVVAFSPDGQHFLSVGIDSPSTLLVWDTKKAKIVARASCETPKVFDAQFHPTTPNMIVTCGLKHLYFWSLSGNVLSPTIAEFGNSGDPPTSLSLGFGPNSVTFSGSLGGSILMWQGTQLQGSIDGSHEGGVFCIYQSEDTYVTGGKDGMVKLWDQNFQHTSTIDMTNLPGGYLDLWVRAVCLMEDKLLVGTHFSEIFEISLRDRENPRCIVNGHGEGELWALATHPKRQFFATGGDDQTIRLWDSAAHRLVHMSSVEQWVRSVAFNGDGSMLAAGLANGEIIILKTKDFAEAARFRDRKRPIHEMKFSPGGDLLGVGCNDSGVDIYHVSQRFKRVGSFPDAGSHITHLDWATDAKHVQINTGAADRIVLKIPGCKRVTAKEEIASIKWHTWTCIIGPEVSGIWPKYAHTKDINALDANIDQALLATGDDFGCVKLMKFPALGKGKGGTSFKKLKGHSAHVTNVRWASDSQYLLSTGGADHSVFQWRLIPQENATKEGIVEAMEGDSEEEKEEEGGAVEDLDSDIEREKLGKGYQRGVPKDGASKAMRMMIRRELKEEGKRRSEPPEATLSLQHVFGYRGYDCHNNILFTQSGEIVYHVAAMGIILNRETGKQRIYVGHTDDILALSIHPQKDIMATGQVGREPVIHVWNAETLKTISILKGEHKAGVCALDFSGDGRRIVSVGLDQYHMIVVWDWKRGERLALTRGHKDKIFGIRFDPADSSRLVSVGVRHIKFWNHTGGGFTQNRGVFGQVAKIETMMCVEYGKEPQVCYSGSAEGNIYCWKEHKLIKAISAHKGPCFTIFALDMGFVTGGKDGEAALWDETFEKPLKRYPVTNKEITNGTIITDLPAIRAVALGHGKIFAGTKNGEIVEIDKSGSETILAQGHCEGEVWGLSIHPVEPCCATVSDDRILRIWCFSERRLLAFQKLGKGARAVHYSPDGKLLAIGFNDGSVRVVRSHDFSQVHEAHHRKEEISDVKFSPDPGSYLAVGSHDNYVDIYEVGSWKRVGLCRGNSSYITHLDWDVSGTLLQTNSGAREHLFFEAPRGTRQSLHPDNAETDIEWHTWSGVMGSGTRGIWPPKSDITDVNATSLHHNKALIATADDFGFVKLFKYPCRGKYAKSKTYIGHSAHVTNCRWSADGKWLLTLGGADTSLALWSLQLGAGHVGGQSDTSDTDSEEEAGYDSDVEQEKNIDYTSKVYSKPLRERLGDSPVEKALKDGAPKKLVSRRVDEPIKVLRTDPSKLPPHRKGKPRVENVNSLSLDYIFGYRGFDCSNNVHYLGEDGAEIVFHAAGAGIVLNLATGQQRFYLEHSDDILCLTVNPHPRHKHQVATAQIDKDRPVIHLWDGISLKTQSILQTKHGNGVNCLSFAPSGRFLLSVGMDPEHSVTVWKWTDGSVLASTSGHIHKICSAQFRPDSDSEFVTVGIKHVKFWTICGSDMVGKKGVLRKTDTMKGTPKMHTMLSIAFAPEKRTLTGCVTGAVYVWKEEMVERVVEGVHGGPIFCMFTSLTDGLIVTGAKEKKSDEGACVKLWDQQLMKSRSFPLNHFQTADPSSLIIKSVSRQNGKIVVGNKACDIMEIPEQSGTPYYVLQSHRAGELWGLAAHPSSHLVATTSHDRTLRLWDIHKKVMLSKMEMSQEGVCVGFSPEGGLVGVGAGNGEVLLFHTADLTPWGSRRDRSSPVVDIKFSPDGKLLAVGYEEGFVDFYDLTKPSMRRVSYCKALHPILQMDFAADSKHIKVSLSNHDLIVYHLPEAKQETDENVLNSIVYFSFTNVCGPEVYGIWAEHSAAGEMNCSDLSHIGNTLATGDDSGFVKLFSFPCPEPNAEHIKYVGHSAHVTNVKFTFDDSYVISTGGDDSCVFVWKCGE